MTDWSSLEPEAGQPVDREREPEWLERLCHIPSDFRTGHVSIRELFLRAAPDVEEPHFVDMVAERLAREPVLVESWQQYSYDKRGTPSPYLDGTEVGFFEVVADQVHYRAVERFDNVIDACSSFIWREAGWVLERRQVVSDPL